MWASRKSSVEFKKIDKNTSDIERHLEDKMNVKMNFTSNPKEYLNVHATSPVER